MRLRRALLFVCQAITVGLAAFVVIVFLKPELLEPTSPVVEVHEGAPTSKGDAGPRDDAKSLQGPGSYADAVAAAAPAVLNIYTTKVVEQRANPLLDDPFFRRFFGDQFSRLPRKRLETSLGSGVILSPQGYAVTNHHVIKGADEILVALRNGRTAQASVVGTDPETDLAVLKVDLDELPSVTVGRSETLRVGDVVLAIGNPFGVGQTVTMGIVSATGRNRLGINTFENFIQTDAAINPGNSGGALVNAHGQLVGINTAIFSQSGGSQGIGFAIPVAIARNVMRQIIEHGRVIRGWLGIEAQEVSPALAESFDAQGVDGVLVAGVLRGGPADRAGLQPGDIITHVDGQAANDARIVLDAIARILPGNEVELQILRQGETRSVTATVGERPGAEG